MTDATLRIYGASDDLVEIDSTSNAGEEFPLPGSDTWEGNITSPDGNQARLYVTYQKNGSWTVTYGQVDEDIPLPTWENRLIYDPSTIAYSAILELTVPTGTTIQPDNGNEHDENVYIA